MARTLDLGGDRKVSAGIQISSLLIAAVAVGLVLLLRLPVDSSWRAWLVVPLTLLLRVAYMVVHELTHGAWIRILSGTKPTYRLRLPFLTTGSDAYLTRNDAIWIALAPSALVQDDGEATRVFLRV